MIPAPELAALRAVATSALDMAGAVVQRATLADDGYGHQTQTWATITTVAAGLAKPTAAIMQAYAARIGTRESWVASLPYGTDCAEGDRLVVSGQTLTVQADLSVSSYSTLKQVLATAIEE